jgi:hypothetical protein
MKAEFMGGPQDGREVELPPGAKEWLRPIPAGKPLTLRDMTTPFVDESVPYKMEKWPVRKLKAPSGRTFLAVVDPSLNAWLDKNFNEKGKKDGKR